MLFELAFVIARSTLSSALKSPTATPWGAFCVPYGDPGGVVGNVPSPAPSRTATPPPMSVAATSTLPSPLKSPVARAEGLGPNEVLPGLLKEPDELPLPNLVAT